MIEFLDDKVKLREMKEAALIKAQQKAEEEAKKRAEKKREFEKHALTKAMDVGISNTLLIWSSHFTSVNEF